MSIGVCVGSATEEKVLEKKRFDFVPISGQEFEKRCWDTFWSKHKDTLNVLTQNAKPAKDQTLAFRAFLDEWHAKSDGLYIVCDNPGFDFGMINYYLDMFGCQTLNYDHLGNYLNNHDADSYGRGMRHQGFNNQWFSNEQACKDFDFDLNPNDHDHMPENDAEFIYKLHRQLVSARL